MSRPSPILPPLPRLGTTLLLAGLACTGVLLWDGARAPTPLPVAPRLPGLDKLLHLSAHLFITTLLLWGAALLRPLLPARAVVAVLLAAGFDLAGGVGVEFVQLTAGREAGRRFEAADIAANACGTMLAVALFPPVAAMLARVYTGGRRNAQSAEKRRA